MLFYMHDVLCAGIRQRFQHRRPLPATARYPLEFYAHIAKGGKAQSSVVTHLTDVSH